MENETPGTAYRRTEFYFMVRAKEWPGITKFDRPGKFLVLRRTINKNFEIYDCNREVDENVTSEYNFALS